MEHLFLVEQGVNKLDKGVSVTPISIKSIEDDTIYVGENDVYLVSLQKRQINQHQTDTIGDSISGYSVFCYDAEEGKRIVAEKVSEYYNKEKSQKQQEHYLTFPEVRKWMANNLDCSCTVSWLLEEEGFEPASRR